MNIYVYIYTYVYTKYIPTYILFYPINIRRFAIDHTFPIVLRSDVEIFTARIFFSFQSQFSGHNHAEKCYPP